MNTMMTMIKYVIIFTSYMYIIFTFHFIFTFVEGRILRWPPGILNPVLPLSIEWGWNPWAWGDMKSWSCCSIRLKGGLTWPDKLQLMGRDWKPGRDALAGLEEGNCRIVKRATWQRTAGSLWLLRTAPHWHQVRNGTLRPTAIRKWILPIATGAWKRILSSRKNTG